MADQKVSDLPSLNGADVDAADLLYIVDSSAGAAGSKKITIGQYQLAPVSGGTANTVVYLNGSKVESSSSALTFDGTNFATTGTSSAAKLIPTGGTATGNGMYLPAANTLAWSNNSAETMRLDSSGNLGLGVTPSAWQTTSYKVLEFPYGVSLFGQTDAASMELATNGYLNSSYQWTYKTSTYASHYRQYQGQHQWFTAPSGTAGNAITFTQAMTLDASGNLGVGATSPNARVNATVTADGADAIRADANSSNGLIILRPDGANGNQIRYGGNGANANILRFVQGGDTERARITSGGDLLVGTTSNTPANTTDAAFCAGSTAGYGSTWQQIPNNAPATYKAFTVFRGNVEIGSISYNGTGVNFNATSDRRLKENIAPAGAAGAVIDAIDIVQHDWKAGGHTRFGVIAQDLNAVAPEAVSAGDDGDEIERTWGVDYSKLVPMLIKEIQSLRARVAALEAK